VDEPSFVQNSLCKTEVSFDWPAVHINEGKDTVLLNCCTLLDYCTYWAAIYWVFCIYWAAAIYIGLLQ